MEVETGVMWPQPRSAGSHQRLKEKTFSSGASGESMVLLTSSFLTTENDFRLLESEL